ncbi:MAG TPA: hypothetical protein PLU10_08060 [Chitinophagaceae bacterium]|nr:hypothetical protein [Chitinophagaceae bacterium]
MIRKKNIAVLGSENRLMATDIFYQTTGSPKPVVVYVHGFNGFKDWGQFDLIANEFAEAGFVFVKFNLSHNGTTLEAPEDFVDLEAYRNNTYSKELFDIRCIIDWLDQPHEWAGEINTHQINLLGHSRGGGDSILYTALDDRIKSLLTWAAVSTCEAPWKKFSTTRLAEWKQQGFFIYHNKRTQQEMPIGYSLYEDYQMHQTELNIESAIRNITVPILICHGTLDEAVPFSAAELLKLWQPQAQLFSIESDHVFGRKHPWLEAHLPKPMMEVIQQSILFLKRKL